MSRRIRLSPPVVEMRRRDRSIAAIGSSRKQAVRERSEPSTVPGTFFTLCVNNTFCFATPHLRSPPRHLRPLVGRRGYRVSRPTTETSAQPVVRPESGVAFRIAAPLVIACDGASPCPKARRHVRPTRTLTHRTTTEKPPAGCRQNHGATGRLLPSENAQVDLTCGSWQIAVCCLGGRD